MSGISAFLALLSIAFIAGHLVLAARQGRYICQTGIDQKTAAYCRAKVWHNAWFEVSGLLLVIYLVASGGIGLLVQTFAEFQAGYVWAAGTILGLQFMLKRLFIAIQVMGIERAFGFSRMGWGLFLGDSFKNVLLAGSAGLLALWLVYAMNLIAQDFFWFWVFGIWFCLVMANTILTPVLMSKLFVRLTLLQDQGLINRLGALTKRIGISPPKIYIAEGSKRSSHGNARVEGMGASRRVVLLDTLLGVLSEAEITAVTAHELGHQHDHHIAKYLLIKAALGAIGLMGVVLSARGLEQWDVFLHLLAGLPVLMFIGRPIVCWCVRRWEYQADDFAARYGQAKALISALDKIHRQNAAMEQSDPWYAFVYQAHPSAMLRKQRLRQERPVYGADQVYVD